MFIDLSPGRRRLETIQNAADDSEIGRMTRVTSGFLSEALQWQ